MNMKIIDIEPNTERTNDSPYIYKVTFISNDGTIRKAISKQSHLEAWLQELQQTKEFNIILHKYQQQS
jgi:hypothetical protein